MPALSVPLDAIPQPAFLHAADGRVAGANRLAGALAGRRLDGMTSAEIVAHFSIRSGDGTPLSPRDLPAALALRGEEAVDVPLTVTTAGGAAMQVLATATPVRGGDAVTGVLVVWQEATPAPHCASTEEGTEFETAFDTSPVGLCLFDRDLRFTRVNRRFAELNGISVEAHLGRTIRESMPSLAETFEAIACSVLETGTAVRDVHVQGQRPGEGGPRHAIMDWTPVRDRDGAITGVSVAVVDITAEARAQEALGESERRYRELVENANSAIIRWSRDGTLTYANEYAETLFGYPPGGMVGLNANDLVPDTASNGADLSTLVRAIVADPEERTTNVNENVRRDGSRLWMVWTNRPIRDAHGEVAEILAVGTDVTAQREAEAALAESEKRFRSIFDNSLDALYRRNLVSGRFEYYSPAIESITGFSVPEVMAMSVDDVLERVHPDDISSVMADKMEITPALTEGTVDYRFLRRDGTYAWVSDRFRIARDADGRPLHRDGIIRDITERKRAEEALAEGESRYRTLFDSIDQGFFVIDVLFDEHDRPVDLYYVEANDAATRMLGQDWTGKRLSELSPDYEQYWFEIFGNVARTGESVRYERYAAPDRTWYDFYVFRIGGPESRRIGNTFLDITDRKRAEEALRTSEARLVEAQRLAQVGDWEWDVPADAVVWSRQTSAIFGRDPDLPAPRFRDEQPRYYTPESWARLSEAAQRALESGEPYDLEVEVVRDDGEHRWLVARGEAVRDASGAVAKLRGTVQEITERKRMEEELRRSSDLTSAILESISDSFMAMDRDWRFTYINRRALEYSGLSSGDVIGRTVWEVFPEVVGTPLAAFYRAAMEGDEPLTFENKSAVATGREFELRAYPTPDGITIYGLEITERKEAEAALREYAANLARSNEDLERFAYVSSHDLQEPLRSIVSFSQLLERRYKGQLDSDADEYIDFIVEGGNRMQTLILDLLAYSRVNSKAQELRPTDAEAVMAAVERSLDSQLREAGAIVTYDPLPTVTADPLQLEQVFANLVSNAIKFRRRDEPLRIHVSARRLDGFWEFSVQDNGIGIEQEYLEKIFVIFQRLHTKDAYPGTGIGLAIVKRIIDRHGGTVRVESTPGEGSTFSFTLPAA